MTVARPGAPTTVAKGDGDTPAGGGTPGSSRRARRWTLEIALAALVVVAASVTVIAVTRSGSPTLTSIRPTGIPGNVSTPVANLMGLTTVPAKPAPGFTLTDQTGQTLSLDSFRGHPVIVEFMDPHCTDICPIVSQEFVDAYRDLGSAGRKAIFVAINVNKYHLDVPAIATFSKAHRLDTIPTWHFFTGALPTLEQLWTRYEIAVTAPGPNADVVHTSVVYFISPSGHERFMANPRDYHTASGKAYLPTNQISAWGHGIAALARDLGA